MRTSAAVFRPMAKNRGMSAHDSITIPASLLPADGRFGAGPSRVRAAQIDALSSLGSTLMGTSHRQAPVKQQVKRLQNGLRQLFSLPDDYEVVLGNGGSTAFWDVAVSSLIEKRAQHVTVGEFSAKFANASAAAPHLESPDIRSAQPGGLIHASAQDDVDAYAWAHNETSTGVMAPVLRPDGARDSQLVLIDATSAAGGLPVDITESDVYYFAPQKSFASDGGLWIALASPSAVARAERIASSGRWIPEFLSFTAALENSRKNQTLNTPAIATIVLMAEQVDWMNENGGLDFCAERTRSASAHLHTWAQQRDELSLFVQEPSHRSQVVTTIDVDESIDASAVIGIMRAHGVVDIDPYRKLGRNQLRIATFPATPLEDVQALTASLDYVFDRLS